MIYKNEIYIPHSSNTIALRTNEKKNYQTNLFVQQNTLPPIAHHDSLFQLISSNYSDVRWSTHLFLIVCSHSIRLDNIFSSNQPIRLNSSKNELLKQNILLQLHIDIDTHSPFHTMPRHSLSILLNSHQLHLSQSHVQVYLSVHSLFIHFFFTLIQRTHLNRL